MRVLMVANTLPPHDLSGVGEQVVQLAAGLRARGHDVRVLGRQPGGARGPKVLFPLTIGRALDRAAEDLEADVIQVHESDAGLALKHLRRLRGRVARPLLVALQQVSYVEERRAVRPLVSRGEVLGRPGAVERRFRAFKAPLQILLGRWTAQAADLVLAPSQATARELERDYGVSGAEVLPNVTGGTEAPPSDPGSDLSKSSDLLLFVGRLRIRKGVEVLFAALRFLAAEGLRPRVVVAGDGEHRAALEATVRMLDLEQQVQFFGRASTAQVRGLFARGCALVVPSIYEGMPLVVLEAMSASLPVVASAVSGIPEVVVDGETGWLVPAEDPRALAHALRSALEDRDESIRRGAAGRVRVEECYRPHHAAMRWEELVNARLKEAAR